jgi:hypothetical protein
MGSRKRAILVLGMHRSGTSALTRVVNLMGADLPKRLLAAGHDNQRGYWEPAELVAIHERLLAAAGRAWDATLPIPEAFWRSPAAEAFAKEILATLRSAFAASALFVVKDPRLCRLLPLWRSVLERLPADPAFVLCIRNPLEVADSLQVRNGFTRGRSVLLWLRHVLEAEAGSRGHPRTVVSYESLVGDWRSVVGRMRRDLPFLGEVSPEAGAAVAAFLDRSLRHEEQSIEDLRSCRDLVDGVLEAYEALAAAERGQDDHLAATLDRVARELAKADRSHGPVVEELEDRLRQASAVTETVRGQWAAAAAEAHRLRGAAKEKRRRATASARKRSPRARSLRHGS